MTRKVDEYIKLQKKRHQIKTWFSQLFGRDITSLIRSYEKEIDKIIITGKDPLKLESTELFRSIEFYIKDLNKHSDNLQDGGRDTLINLHNNIKEALEFKYPVDYRILPKVHKESQPVIREVRALINSYRDGKIHENTLRRSVKKRLYVPAHQADSLIITQLAGFDNSAAKTIADLSGLRKALYFGSIGDNTRIFCEALLRQKELYSENQIKEMSNGQGLPVITYCGGYRCMHEWLWVDEQWGEVKELLKKTA